MKLPLVLTTLALAASAATAGPGCCGDQAGKTCDTPKPAETKKVEIVCPVMNRKIASPEKASGKSVYQGTTYYFCCKPCKSQFDKNPARYVKAAAAKESPKTGSPEAPKAPKESGAEHQGNAHAHGA